MNANGIVAICMIVGILFLMTFNVPIAYCIGASALAVALFTGVIPVNYICESMFTAYNSFTIMAIPFFILAGDIMLVGGVSTRLVNCAKAWLGWVPASLGVVAVVACMFFAALSGSGPATAAAIGSIMIPAMVKDGYKANFSVSLNAVAAALGPIIPPSILFVTYGVLTNASVGDMFIGGIGPGVLIGVCLIIYTIVASKVGHWELKKPEKITWKQRWHETIVAIPALLMPVIILGGIYGGIFTPTEAAVVACVYGLIVSMFIYKELPAKNLFVIFSRTGKTLGASVIIMGLAAVFSRILTILGAPDAFAKWLVSVLNSKFLILLGINILLIFVGMLMETISAMIILVPILLPVVRSFGMSDIQFGIVLCANLAVGLATPPVGVNTFVCAPIGKVEITQCIKPLLGLCGVAFACVLLTTYIPAISLALVG